MKEKRLSIAEGLIAIIFSITILLVSQIVAGLLASVFLLVNVPAFLCIILGSIVYVAFAYILIKLVCDKVMSFTLVEIKVPKISFHRTWVIVGVLLPVIVTLVYFCFPGSFQTMDLSMPEKLEVLSSGIFLAGIAAAVVEEMVFRGVIMTVLNDWFGKEASIILPSLLFGIVHIIGSGYSSISNLLVILAGTFVGIMFSLICYSENSIWNSAFVHGIWNVVIIGGIVSIGSGVNESALFSYVLKSDSFVLTGGDFGIEASLIALIGYTIVILFALYRNAKVKN